MYIKESVHDDVVVLSPRGNLMGEPDTVELRDKIKSLIADGVLRVVLDVEKIVWVNSAGLGSMIASLASLNNIGGDLRIANITDKIESLFLITQLVKVFKTFDSTDRAIASFVKDPIAGRPPSH